MVSIMIGAREHTGTAPEVLVAIAARGVSESARVAAACAILDRGWGIVRRRLI